MSETAHVSAEHPPVHQPQAGKSSAPTQLALNNNVKTHWQGTSDGGLDNNNVDVIDLTVNDDSQSATAMPSARTRACSIS